MYSICIAEFVPDVSRVRGQLKKNTKLSLYVHANRNGSYIMSDYFNLYSLRVDQYSLRS